MRQVKGAAQLKATGLDAMPDTIGADTTVDEGTVIAVTAAVEIATVATVSGAIAPPGLRESL